MKVRELIEQLLEFDMSREVEIELNLNDETYEDSIDDIWEERAPIGATPDKVLLHDDLDDYVLVDQQKYERMKDRISELEES